MRNIKIFFMFFLLNFAYLSSGEYEELYMNESSFESFLSDFVPKVANKEKMLNKALWILETTGSKDASELVAALDEEYKLLFHDSEVYEYLLNLQQLDIIKDKMLKRQLDILVLAFKSNMLPEKLLNDISVKEAALSQTYASFRTVIDGKSITENEIREILKNEKSISIRKKIWEASKDVGMELAPKILELVKLRNEVAKHLGYEDYFDMKLDLQEVSKDKLLKTFNDLADKSENAYDEMIEEINDILAKKFAVSKDELGPWAWSDPFCQMDPLESTQLDDIMKDKDILAIVKKAYDKMGFDVDSLIEKSDLYERENKNQHAFCISIDRYSDVRTLNNIKPNIRWLETVMHEFGHGLYDLHLSDDLPWLLREPPHMIPTEAIALLMGRCAYSNEFLNEFCDVEDENILLNAEDGLRRRQLIFSRSVFVITEFEKELYKDPEQDLNNLWWNLVEKYQKIAPPKNRGDKSDWAAKYHVGLAPVYYYSYLLGEVFASSLSDILLEKAKEKNFFKEEAGQFLTEKLFNPGNTYRWDKLIEFVTNEPLSIDAWVEHCMK